MSYRGARGKHLDQRAVEREAAGIGEIDCPPDAALGEIGKRPRFGFCQIGTISFQKLRDDCPAQLGQRKPPATGTDRRQKPARAVADQQQERAARRLLQDLEERVGGIAVHLLRAVDDHDAPAPPRPRSAGKSRRSRARPRRRSRCAAGGAADRRRARPSAGRHGRRTRRGERRCSRDRSRARPGSARPSLSAACASTNRAKRKASVALPMPRGPLSRMRVRQPAGFEEAPQLPLRRSRVRADRGLRAAPAHPPPILVIRRASVAAAPYPSRYAGPSSLTRRARAVRGKPQRRARAFYRTITARCTACGSPDASSNTQRVGSSAQSRGSPGAAVREIRGRGLSKRSERERSAARARPLPPADPGSASSRPEISEGEPLQ